ncbi:unnamed protein product [Adineta ricciae]|uniref:Methyltransferase type 11 domain-containing protein n=1 Tax=Adineta ricciae TaxID=249248 RepID=A0A815C5T5_ADIRI|nr:unnamed protein product [Adineta ricciae]CAF1278952.1 unnamed protein product [Adineta ricciae]
MGRCVKFLFSTFAIIIAILAIGIGYLKVDDVFREQLFARVLNMMSNPNNVAMMDLRCNQLLKHSNVKGHILEIGSGTGINLPCLHNNTNIESYTGIEPNVYTHPYFYKLVEQYDDISYNIRLSNDSAADMKEIPSDSIDTVIMTFVLCSIPDPIPDKVLREVHRILKPGGKFLFFEHTLAHPEKNPLIYQFQRTIEPVWEIIGNGCRFKPITNYFDAMKSLYSKVEYKSIALPVPMFFVKDGVRGQLIK